MKDLQRKTFEIVREEEDKSTAGEIFDWVMTFLIVLNLAFLILGTFTFARRYKTLTFWVESITTVVFTLEYFVRLWVAPLYSPGVRPARARLKYIFSFMAVVDFLSVMPFYLPFILPVDLRILRIFRLIRLLRIVKVSRYTNAVSTLISVFRKKAGQLAASLLVMFLLIVLAAILMYDIEHDAQPEVFNNASAGLSWAFKAITTVGNSDIQPVTIPGRLLGAVISLLGIGVVAVPTGIISAGFISAVGESSDGQISAADEISKYKNLLDDGAITLDEYNAKKKQLLEKDNP